MRSVALPWKPRWIELSVGLTALVVSVVSLFIARRQTEVMDRQLAASVWPAIQYYTSNLDTGEPVITLGIENVGIGPARIRSFRIGYKNRPVRGGEELLTACCVPEGASEPFQYITSFVSGRIIPAGESLTFLTLRRNVAGSEVFGALNQARGDLDVRICFCSVLDDCWLTMSGGPEPKAVPTCAREAERVQYVE